MMTRSGGFNSIDIGELHGSSLLVADMLMDFGGGLDVKGNPVKNHGDCGNRSSPRFTTTADDVCNQFFPCSTRWPDADHG